jgi:hypothetical protein
VIPTSGRRGLAQCLLAVFGMNPVVLPSSVAVGAAPNTAVDNGNSFRRGHGLGAHDRSVLLILRRNSRPNNLVARSCRPPKPVQQSL